MLSILVVHLCSLLSFKFARTGIRSLRFALQNKINQFLQLPPKYGNMQAKVTKEKNKQKQKLTFSAKTNELRMFIALTGNLKLKLN